MKTFTTDLGGMTREFKFTRKERAELEEMFGMGLHKLITDRVIPVDEKGRYTGNGMIAAQEALVFFGLRHRGSKISQAWVSEKLLEHPNPYDVIAAAAMAVYASGVLGFKISGEEPEEQDEEKKEPGAIEEISSAS